MNILHFEQQSLSLLDQIFGRCAAEIMKFKNVFAEKYCETETGENLTRYLDEKNVSSKYFLNF